MEMIQTSFFSVVARVVVLSKDHMPIPIPIQIRNAANAIIATNASAYGHSLLSELISVPPRGKSSSSLRSACDGGDIAGRPDIELIFEHVMKITD